MEDVAQYTLVPRGDKSLKGKTVGPTVPNMFALCNKQNLYEVTTQLFLLVSVLS